MGNGAQDCGRLIDLAAEAIQDLRSRGCTVTDSDVCRLNALAWRIQSPAVQRELSKGRPVQCGNVWLWPLTVNATAWLQDVGFHLEHSEEALCYAMAHREKDLYTTTEDEILEWFKTIQATVDEVREAMAAIIDASKRDSLPTNRKDIPTVQEIAQMMVDQHGGSFEMWERQCSLDYIFDFIETTSKQEQAEQKRNRVNRATMIMGRYTQSLLRRARNG